MQKNKNTVPLSLKPYIEKGKVVIFAYSYCPNASKANDLLSNLNIKPDIIYIDQDENFKSNKELTKDLEVHSQINIYPKIYTGTSCIGSYTDLYDLFTYNKLFEILKSEGIKFIEDDYY